MTLLVGTPALVLLTLGLKPYRTALAEAEKW
jgi:hypothetical protein